jgi:DNA processing protein
MLPHPVDDDAVALLALTRVPGIGAVRGAALLLRFGDAATALREGLAGRWPELPGWRAEEARGAGAKLSLAEAWREVARANRLGARLMVHGRPPYPSHWRLADGLPLALWWRGEWPEGLQRSPPAGVAIVGPRRATPAALQFAERLAERTAVAGAVVVSGLAFGVDAAAHRGAIAARRAGATVSTVAVLASGVDNPTPAAHRPLARDILTAGGALVSAAGIGAKPAVGSFPERNHTIAGLVGAVAVIEAGLKSGSLHTARSAAELGVVVGTTPGRPWDLHAAGSLALLRDGATPLLEVDDGWRLLPPGTAVLPPPPATSALPVAPVPYAARLARGPCSAAALADASGESLTAVLAALELGVLSGWAERLEDGRYRLPRS